MKAKHWNSDNFIPIPIFGKARRNDYFCGMKTIFDSTRLGALTLKNRIWRSATWMALSPDGKVNDELIDVYRNYARVLLKQSEKTVLQISEDLGFPNAPFFCRYFKRETGMTPSEYRES